MAHQARVVDWDPIPRIALGPAVMETASTGRTHDCTRPVCTNLTKTLAKREPSPHDPQRKSSLDKQDGRWSLTSLREKLVKIGARIVTHSRYVTFQMAEVAVPRMLFAQILRLIAELRPPPDPAPA